MDPISVTGLAGEAGGKRLSTYFTVQLTSVLLPGVVTVVGATVLLMHAEHGDGTWAQIVRFSEDVHGPLAILLAVLLAAVSYVVGYVTREIAFQVLGLAERVSRKPHATAAELHRQLRARYGDRAVDSCFLAHPLLARFLSAEQDSDGVGRDGLGGALAWGNSLEAFVYAKQWLREVMPDLAPFDTEREINILVSTLFPIGLGTWLFSTLGGPGPLAVTSAALTGAVLCWLVLSSAMRLRRSERWESLRGLVEGNEMRLALARQQEPPAAPGLQPTLVPGPDGGTRAV
ncbi:hypothetical protein ACIHCQ_38220 [Streptomyces sp. NPDC052236]|uniref:hypothetical protein n=1 Tax=Streptomyces sp. NPDC052236 TaxID=3365686 RepID=UPI0037D82960